MTHIRQRIDTAANWTVANPVLDKGEVGWESDSLRSKVGDGVTNWRTLTYTDKSVRDIADNASAATDSALASYVVTPSSETRKAIEAIAGGGAGVASNWARGMFLANTEALSMAQGVYYSSGSGIATLIGPPQIPPVARYQGVLEVVTANTMRLYRWTVLQGTANGFQVWEIAYTGSAWGKWQLTSSMNTPNDASYTVSNLDDANEGTYQVLSGATIVSLGLPGTLAGYLKLTDLGGSFARRIAEYTNIAGEKYVASRASGVWTDWALVNASGVGDATPSGWKTTALAVTAGRGSLVANASGTWRCPVHWNIPIRRFRVRVTLRNARYDGLVQGAGVAVDGIWLGDHAGAGAFTAAPRQIAGPFTVPDNGDAWVSAWIDAPIGENVERLLSFSYTATTAPSLHVGYAFQHAGKVAAQVAPAGGATVVAVPMDIAIEAEIPATVPVLATVGDSKSCGVGATRSILDSTISQYCRTHGAAPMHFSSSGDSMKAYSTSTYKLTRWKGVVSNPDYVVLELGINDLLTDTAATMATSRAAVVAKIKADISPEIGVVTLAPNEAETTERRTQRLAYNTALRAGLPADVNRLFDFDAAIKLSDTEIKPAYDADGLHLNAAGYAAEAATLRHVAVPSGSLSQRVDNTAGRAIYTWDDTANREQLIYGDTGWRDISSLLESGWTGGSVRLRRVGQTVSLRFSLINPASATGTTVLNLPPGFRASVFEYTILRPASGSSFPVGSINNAVVYLTTDSGPGSGGNDFLTNDPWPTTLPGTPVGPIPNL